MNRSAVVGVRAVAVAVALVSTGGCELFKKISKQPVDDKPHVMALHSFSDTLSATSVAATDNALWVGTQHGLIKWDTRASTFTMITKTEGLPADKVSAIASDDKGGVFVMTPAGLAHMAKGAWSNFPTVPVGDFVTGMVVSPDGALWAAGPEGLARLGKDGKWERFLGTASVTAIAAVGPDLWVGLQGRGIARITKSQVALYGPEQGCETDVVRGLAVTPNGLIAIGKDPQEQQRVCVWDGKRFWSYKVEGFAGDLEWARHIGNDVLVAGGTQMYSVARAGFGAQEGGPRLVALDDKGARKQPLVGVATSDLPEAPKPGAAPAPDEKDKSKKKSSDGDEPAQHAADAPVLEVHKWGPALPEGVTAVGPDGAALYVGTRFLGAARIEAESLTPFRISDLAASAVRLTVACAGKDDCYVATGGPRAWHFDGHSFDTAQIDPEPGSRVLAIVDQPSGGLLAVHRGGTDPVLRVSTEAGGNWTPIGVQEVHVPEGQPDITFAVYAPDKHLWLGVNYLDKNGDRTDYGAAELILEQAQVIYHRRFGATAAAPDHGYMIPDDVESCFFRSDSESWFGTHAGVARVLDKQIKIFTENDGLESEFIRDILEGPDGLLWVATSRGVGKFDGKRWIFPSAGEPLRVRTTSLARDGKVVFIGTENGLLTTTATGVEPLAAAKGLLDPHVLNLAIDKNRRLWVLTEKGLSIIDR